MLTLPAVLTYTQALETERALQAQLASQPSIVMDASALTQFDSSTLAVLLSCRRQALVAGKTFAVQGMPGKLAQLAGLYGVSKLLGVAA